MPARLIFLDLDGVLRPFHSEELLERACVERLNGLIDQTGAAVVITSSWRAQLTLEEIQTELDEAGFRHALHGETPILRGLPRGEEIRSYLARSGVVPFVILDDELDMDHELRRRLVHVSDTSGLQDADVLEAVALLAQALRII